MAPKHKCSDAGSSDMPKRTWKVLPLKENVKVLKLIRKKKYHMLKLLISTVKSNLPSWNCLMYRLNFIIGSVYGKHIVNTGFGTMPAFRHPRGVLECIPMDKGSTAFINANCLNRQLFLVNKEGKSINVLFFSMSFFLFFFSLFFSSFFFFSFNVLLFF